MCCARRRVHVRVSPLRSHKFADFLLCYCMYKLKLFVPRCELLFLIHVTYIYVVYTCNVYEYLR